MCMVAKAVDYSKIEATRHLLHIHLVTLPYRNINLVYSTSYFVHCTLDVVGHIMCSIRGSPNHL